MSADLHHGCDVAGVDREAVTHRRGSFGEKPHRRGCLRFVGRGVRCGEREGLDPPYLFAVEAKRLTTRHQHMYVGAVGHNRVDEICGGVQHVFAVVQHDQHASVGQIVDERVGGCGRRADRGSHGLEHFFAVRDRRQFDQPAAVGEPGRERGRDPKREPRLADTAHTGQRDQPLAFGQLHQCGHVVGATDQLRAHGRQVRRHRIHRPQRREHPVAHLEHLLRRRQIPEPMLSQAPQRRTIPDKRRRRLRAHHLPAMSHGHQPRRPIHRRTEIVPIAFGRLTRVHADSHADRGTVRPWLRA